MTKLYTLKGDSSGTLIVPCEHGTRVRILSVCATVTMAQFGLLLLSSMRENDTLWMSATAMAQNTVSTACWFLGGIPVNPILASVSGGGVYTFNDGQNVVNGALPDMWSDCEVKLVTSGWASIGPWIVAYERE